MELSASCYRVCENAGTLAVQVVRSGNSVDPAYVSVQVCFIVLALTCHMHLSTDKVIIQVEEGTAKDGKDFTHSSANLIQFDPGGYLILHFLWFVVSNMLYVHVVYAHRCARQNVEHPPQR